MRSSQPRVLVVVLAIVLSACADNSIPDRITTIPDRMTTIPDRMTTIPAATDSSGNETESEVGSIGVIGCSMTLNALEGYQRLGGESLWARVGLSYGRGSVARWSDPGAEFWEDFEKAYSQRPHTRVVWWQLCTSGADDDDLVRAVSVLERIESLVRDARIVVSAQPAYSRGHVCSSAGQGGPERMAELADRLVATGRVQSGPVITPLAPGQLVDSCHANDEGKMQMGSEILEFFETEIG